MDLLPNPFKCLASNNDGISKIITKVDYYFYSLDAKVEYIRRNWWINIAEETRIPSNRNF